MNFNFFCLNIQWIFNEESGKKSTEINFFGKLSAFSLYFDFCFPFANDQKFVQKLAELWLNKEFPTVYLCTSRTVKNMKMKENR